MPVILIVEPGRNIRTLPLVKRITSLGGSSGCDILVRGAAEVEATIVQSPSGWAVTPFGERSSIEIGGKRIRKEVALSAGISLRLGDALLVFADGETASTGPAETQGTEPGDDGSALVDALRTFTSALARDFTLDSLLNRLLDGCIAAAGAERGFLLLQDGDGYRVQSARNVEQEKIPQPEALLSDSIVRQVLDTGAPLLVSDAVADNRFHAARSVIDLKLMSVLAVPIVIKGDALGVIYLGNNRFRNRFDDRKLAWTSVLAAQAALLLTNLFALRDLRDELREKRLGEMLGSCRGIQEVFRKIERVARVNVDVLVTGETGTGKELVAREIHRLSERPGRFVALNCGAIPENLIESELFGHVRGAFTGAVKDREGCFQSANGGTLFLDEIGELPLGLQVKLLRVLQERVVTRVGSDRPEEIDVRMVAATHRDLQAEVAAGRFREDLLYRLNVVPVEVPPLRERGEDILLLAKYFLGRYREELKSPAGAFSKEALVSLREYDWPGNIRELENRIKRALVLTEHAQLTPEDLGLRDYSQQVLTLADAKERFQSEYIDRVLEINGGNRTKTASDLGVDPRTIYRHLARSRDVNEDDLLREDGSIDPA